MFLSDTVRAVCGLVLRRQIPPRIVMNDHIRAHQIQSGSARLQRNQEYRCAVFIKGMHQPDSFFLRRRSGYFIIGNIFFFQILFQQFQHGGKLRKQQHPVSAVHGTPDQIQNSLPLGGSAGIVFQNK